MLEGLCCTCFSKVFIGVIFFFSDRLLFSSFMVIQCNKDKYLVEFRS